MSGYLISFVKKFAPKAARTTAGPNARSVTSLWSRLFDLEAAQQEEDKAEQTNSGSGEENSFAAGPINSEANRELRMNMLAENYRQIMNQRPMNVRPASTSRENRMGGVVETTNQPDLSVARGGDGAEYIYLAQ